MSSDSWQLHFKPATISILAPTVSLWGLIAFKIMADSKLRPYNNVRNKLYYVNGSSHGKNVVVCSLQINRRKLHLQYFYIDTVSYEMARSTPVILSNPADLK